MLVPEKGFLTTKYQEVYCVLKRGILQYFSTRVVTLISAILILQMDSLIFSLNVQKGDCRIQTIKRKYPGFQLAFKYLCYGVCSLTLQEWT